MSTQPITIALPRPRHSLPRWRRILRKLAGFVASFRDPNRLDYLGPEIGRALGAGPAR